MSTLTPFAIIESEADISSLVALDFVRLVCKPTPTLVRMSIRTYPNLYFPSVTSQFDKADIHVNHHPCLDVGC